MDAEPATVASDDDFDYVRVFENVGTKIYKYFQPEEIFRMSLANRHVCAHVRQHLISLFKQNIHLPLMLDLGPCINNTLEMGLAGTSSKKMGLVRWFSLRPRTKAMFTSGDLFPTEERLVNYIVQVLLGGSDLRAIGREGGEGGEEYQAQTLEESLDIAREGLNAGRTVRLGISDDVGTGSVRLQPSSAAPNAFRLLHDPDTTQLFEEGMISCSHAHIDRDVARTKVDFYFRGQRGYKAHAKSWLHYILSQPDTLAKKIRYVFVHPNRIESMMTEGLIISNATVGDSLTVRFVTKV